jgi:hypothetical protein
MTGAVAAITITGTIYGAQLKSGQDINKVRAPSFLNLLPSCPFIPSFALYLLNECELLTLIATAKEACPRSYPRRTYHATRERTRGTRWEEE